MRDYKAEYARRNALAQSRGFSGYSQQRRAIERGQIQAIQPNRIRSERTRANQRRNNPPVWSAFKQAAKSARDIVSEVFNDISNVGIDAAEIPANFYDTAVEATREGSQHEQNQRWADTHFHSGASDYNPEYASNYNMTMAEYDQAYYDAWVDPDNGYYEIRDVGDTGDYEDLETWLCDVMEIMTHEDFRERYGLK